MAAMASMPPTAPAGNNMRLLPSCAADLSRRNSAASASAPTEISRQSIPRRSTVSACSATAAWPRDFGNEGGFAREQLIEGLDDVDPAELRPRLAAATGSGERADDAHAIGRAGAAQRGEHVLRHAAAADEADRCHLSIIAD